MVQYIRNMTKKTITNIFTFVIFLVLFISIFSACDSRRRSSGTSHYDPPKKVGNLADPEIDEASGLIASRCNPGVFWTHNDSGDDAFIFAVAKTGASLGTWRIPRATNVDWEDIAEYKDKSGKCFIYIGEIGDNRERIKEHVIYRVPEPTVMAEEMSPSKKNARMTDVPDILRFTYPDGPHNAETLMVEPRSAAIYVLTKDRRGPAAVFRLKPSFNDPAPIQAEKIAEISVPAIMGGLITGGDISPDGRRMILCDYVSGYEYVLPDGSDRFDDMWGQSPKIVDIGDRSEGEAACYGPNGEALYSTSEGVGAPIYEILRRN